MLNFRVFRMVRPACTCQGGPQKQVLGVVIAVDGGAALTQATATFGAGVQVEVV